MWRGRLGGEKKEPVFERTAVLLNDTTYKIPEDKLKPGDYVYKVRISNADGGKYPSAFSDAVDFSKPNGE